MCVNSAYLLTSDTLSGIGWGRKRKRKKKGEGDEKQGEKKRRGGRREGRRQEREQEGGGGREEGGEERGLIILGALIWDLSSEQLQTSLLFRGSSSAPACRLLPTFSSLFGL